MSRKPHNWTDTEVNYLREVAKGSRVNDICKLMTNKFNYEFSYCQIRSAMSRYNIANEMKGKKPSGYEPWNKGIKVGNSHLPGVKSAGTEVVSKNGFIKIKLENPSRWEYKHRYIYEQKHGKLDKNELLVFLDGDKKNLSLDNLVKVQKGLYTIMIKHKLLYNDPELTKVGIRVAEMILKTNEVKRSAKK